MAKRTLPLAIVLPLALACTKFKTPVDAGMDRPPLEAGTPDAPAVEAGSPDASTGDSPASDRTPSDAPSADVGGPPIDTARSDAPSADMGGPADTVPEARDTGGETSGPDTTPPTVVSISPADHAVGVTSDAKIVITFSERMDQSATQAAYQSPDIPAASSVLTWNAAGTEFTVAPNAPLAYAIGMDPSMISAKVFSILITTTAADVAGNHLAADFRASFSTRRRVQGASQPLVAALSGTCAFFTVFDCASFFYLGDTPSNVSTRCLLTFDISGLPNNVRDIEAATLQLDLVRVKGAPLSLGAVGVDQVTFADRQTGYGATPRRTLGTFPVDVDSGQKVFSLVDGVTDDYANRSATGGQTQYRLSTAIPTNGDGIQDTYDFWDSTGNTVTPDPELLVTYTID
jgi:hypothetical protein